MLFAGNLQGRTQTMPLLVYGALEQDLRVTFVTALILLALAVLAFTLTRWLAGIPPPTATPPPSWDESRPSARCWLTQSFQIIRCG